MFVNDNMVKYALLKCRRPPPIFSIHHRLISVCAGNWQRHSHSSSSSSSKSGHKDYYQVLNIHRNSTRKEIKLAYYKLAKKYHPDVSEIENTSEKYKDVQEAYHVLGDERRKNEYDEALNDGYYSGPSSAESSQSERTQYGPGDRFRKNRSGPIYSGRTAYYDFDQHYRGHYGSSTSAKRSPGSFSAGFGSSSSSTMNDEELSGYWKNKENSQAGAESDFGALRNRILFRSFFALAGTVILYFMLNKMKRQEEEIRYRNYLKNASSNNNSSK